MERTKRFLRVWWRSLKLGGALVCAAVDYLIQIYGRSRYISLETRARWMQRQSQRILKALSIEVTYRGVPPENGVLVCNHLGYLDILLLGARHPCLFISKEEVSRWPVFGLLTRMAGTLFIRREMRSDILRVANEMTSVVQQGVVLTFFPEGTSSGGEGVLPFHAALLATVARAQWPVSPAAIRYDLPCGEGSVSQEVAYWGEMTFGPHLLNLMGKERIHAFVHYGETRKADKDRRVLAHELHAEVSQLLLRRSVGSSEKTGQLLLLASGQRNAEASLGGR